jgi:hypothetical protein
MAGALQTETVGAALGDKIGVPDVDAAFDDAAVAQLDVRPGERT